MKCRTNLHTGFPSHFSYVFAISTRICYSAQPVPGAPAPPRAGTSGGTSLTRNSTYSQPFRETLFPLSSALGRPELLHAVILPSCSTSLFFLLPQLFAFPCLPVICSLHICFRPPLQSPESTLDKILALKHSLCSLQQTNP